jgi:hypothetical protein
MIPESYVITKFYEIGIRPKHNKYNNTYQCGCPVCREGKSSRAKRRCYYIPKKNNIYCHNCGWSSTPVRWISTVTGMSYDEINNESRDYVPDLVLIDEELKPIKTETLPKNCINVIDDHQLQYHKNDTNFQKCYNLMVKRRLLTAVNRPTTLYISLVDIFHKNRIVIPFYDEGGNIKFFQTRRVLDDGTENYKSKINGDKTLFNIDKVNKESDFVYIFEGPIDAFFVRDSVAVAGITLKGSLFTPYQKQQIETTLKLHKRIWVLDSQWKDNTSLIKSEKLLQDGETVFLWPEQHGKIFKDFNEIAMRKEVDEIPQSFIQKNSYSGLEGIFKLAEIKKFSLSCKQ